MRAEYDLKMSKVRVWLMSLSSAFAGIRLWHSKPSTKLTSAASSNSLRMMQTLVSRSISLCAGYREKMLTPTSSESKSALTLTDLSSTSSASRGSDHISTEDVHEYLSAKSSEIHTHHFLLHLFLRYIETFGGEYFSFWLPTASVSLGCAAHEISQVK